MRSESASSSGSTRRAFEWRERDHGIATGLFFRDPDGHVLEAISYRKRRRPAAAVTSAVLVHVPVAEPIVGRWRRAHTYDAPLGMPPHVTILYPFVPREKLAEAMPRLAKLVAEHEAFDATFARTARFPGLLYLEPEPAEPFLRLTEAVAAAWPEHPPYEGAHENLIPHLTVAESEDSSLLDSITPEVEPRLPISHRVGAVSLFVEGDDGRWREHSRLPLG